MAKGAEAKANVVKKIQAAFGADFVGEYDKKVYVCTGNYLAHICINSS